MAWLHIVRGLGSGTWVALNREETVIRRAADRICDFVAVFEMDRPSEEGGPD